MMTQQANAIDEKLCLDTIKSCDVIIELQDKRISLMDNELKERLNEYKELSDAHKKMLDENKYNLYTDYRVTFLVGVILGGYLIYGKK